MDGTQDAKACGDCVVMMTTGWRNVPSTANVLYEIVVEAVNLRLAYFWPCLPSSMSNCPACTAL